MAAETCSNRALSHPNKRPHDSVEAPACACSRLLPNKEGLVCLETPQLQFLKALARTTTTPPPRPRRSIVTTLERVHCRLFFFLHLHLALCNRLQHAIKPFLIFGDTQTLDLRCSEP